MHYLLLSILASTVFGAGLKISEVQERRRVSIAFFNYLAGAVLAAGYWIFFADARMELSAHTLVVGALAGATWTAGLIAMMVAIKEVGIALTTAIARLSVVVPVIACAMYWKEGLSFERGAGIALACLAMLLLSSRAAKRGGRATIWGVTLLVLLFVSQGAAQTVLKAFEAGPSGEQVTAFMMVLFATSAVLTGAMLAVRQRKLQKSDAVFGAVISLPNVLSGTFTILALGLVAGTVVYPVTSAGSVLALSLLGVFVWKEKLGARGAAGLALAVLALVLINLK